MDYPGGGQPTGAVMEFEIRIDAGFAGKEWLVTNGLGGYASGTLTGSSHRRHDGMLVAALPAPFGRCVMIDRLVETLRLDDGSRVPLFDLLREFRLEAGLPVWRFAGHGRTIERRLVMPHGQNSTHLATRLLDGDPLTLEIRPWLNIRGNDGWLDRPLGRPASVRAEGTRLELAQGALPPVRLELRGPDSRLLLDGGAEIEEVYPIEAERDYPSRSPLWCPGTLSARLDQTGVVLLITTEDWATADALTSGEAFAAESERRRRLIAQADPTLRRGAAAQMVLAADSFLFDPRTRHSLVARAKAHGDELCTVIAGYPWFMDWGRDTMISLEGLTLVTGRWRDAGWILRTFAHYVRDGLIPSNIPDGATEGVYHAVDATLWFFHAIDRFVAHSGDEETLALILPKLVEILDAHRRGTRFGIGVDPADGLLRQGAEGYMLTWMDSATPRRGKPVEVNALWYNALRLMEGWLGQAGDKAGAAQAGAEAERARDSFNRRFWNPARGALFDVIDGEQGDDESLRCNQIMALSLPHPVLARQHWRPVFETVRSHLLTPVGLRSLSPQAPDYCPTYAGNLASRDRAYHRGTIWPWLLGPFIDAWLRVEPDDRAGARATLEGLIPHLSDYCVGTVAEVFDGDAPHTPRGCTAQAWSVAEWLRAWVRTA